MSRGKLSESGNEWILEKETRNKKKKKIEKKTTTFLPFLFEVHIFVWKNAEDLVEHLVRTGLAG